MLHSELTDDSPDLPLKTDATLTPTASGEPRQTPWQQLQHLAGWILDGCGLGLLIVLLSTPFSRSYPFELLTHFSVQFCLCAWGVLFGNLLLKRWRRGMLSLLLVAWLVGPILPYYLNSPEPVIDSLPVQRVISYNCLSSNSRRVEVEQFLQASDAHVVVLLEVNRAWKQQLEGWSQNYPYQLLQAREHNFGMWVLSKYPFLREAVYPQPDADIPFMIVQVNLRVN